MSDSINNNNNDSSDQKEREVEGAVGRTYLQGGDNSRDIRLYVTTTRNFETAQPEEAIVATQLDVLAGEQEESEGSSSEGSGPSSEGSGSLPYLLEAIGSRVGNGCGCKGRSKARSQAKLKLHWQVFRTIRQQAWTN